MKVPVPDDYELGQGLTCFQVNWPDTPQWIALLHGFISAIGHGRFWDENTGVITDVQEIAREIWSATIPLALCDDCSGDNDGDNGSDGAGPVGAIVETLGDVLMTNCSIPYGSIRWNGGVLQIRYCGEWYDVEGEMPTSVTLPSPGDDDYTDFTEGGLTAPNPCSQATVIAEIMFGVVDSLLDDAATPEEPWIAINNVKALYPSIAWGDTSLLSGYLSALSIRAQGYASETEGADAQQAIKCAMSKQSSGDAGGWDSDTRAAVQQALYSAAGEYFTIVAYPTAWSEMKNIYLQAYRGIGATDTQNLTSLAYATGNEDCSCPGEDGTEAWPILEEWYIAYSFQGTHPSYWTLGTDNGNTIITARGAELEANTTGSDKVSLTWNPPVTTGTITRVKLEMLINDSLVDSFWTGLGLQVKDVGNYLQGELVGTNGIYVYLNEACSIGPSGFYTTSELNADSAYDPMAVVYARIILAGTGAHPLGL